MSEWVRSKIKDLFESSIPGDWGLEGSPDGGTPVLRSTNFRNDGSIDYSDIAYRKIDLSRLDKRRVGTGIILIEKSGGSPTQAAGRVVYCERDFNGTASNFIEIVKVKKDVASKYVANLLYHLYQCGLVRKYQQQTTGIINFKLAEYVEEYVTLPSQLAEQTTISEVLSLVDRAIEQTKALIAKQERIKTGLVQDLLTRGIDEHGNLRSESTHEFKDSPLGRIPRSWEVAALEDIASIVDPQPDHRTPAEYPDGVPYIGLSDFQSDGTIDFQGARKISHTAFAKQQKSFSISEGDFVFGKIGTIGLPKRIPTSPNYALSANIILIHPRETPSFVYWWIESPIAKALVDLELHTTSQPAFGIQKMRSFPVPMPDMSERESIGGLLDRVESERTADERALRKLRSLKTGLMQNLLTGKKRVTSLLEFEPTR